MNISNEIIDIFNKVYLNNKKYIQNKFNYKSVSKSYAILLVEDSKRIINEMFIKGISYFNKKIKIITNKYKELIEDEFKKINENFDLKIENELNYELNYFSLIYPNSNDLIMKYVNNTEVNDTLKDNDLKSDNNQINILEKRMQDLMTLFADVIKKRIEINTKELFVEFINLTQVNIDILLDKMQNIIKNVEKENKEFYIEYINKLNKYIGKKSSYIENLAKRDFEIDEKIDKINKSISYIRDTINKLEDLISIKLKKT